MLLFLEKDVNFMKFNKSVMFVCMVIFLLSLNFIVAKDVNETDLNSESFESDYDNLISIDNTNSQDNTNLNQINSIQSSNSSESTNSLSKENADCILVDDGDEFKHVYVSPNGTGDGLDNNNPGNFITTLPNVQDNTIIHMLDGNYSIASEIKFTNKNNISIIADNPGQVTLYRSGNNNYIFNNFENVVNIHFENIIFSGDPTKTNNNFIRSLRNNIDISFENCSFLTSTLKGEVIRLTKSTTNIVINNCYFSGWGKFVASAGNVLINNSVFKIGKLENETSTSFCSIATVKDTSSNTGVANFIVVNSNFTSSYDYITLYSSVIGYLTFENNNLDRPYSFKIDGGKFTPHTTLTFLNGEESVTVGDNSNWMINASLVDDYGNIIILPNIKCTIFEQERTLSYSNGVYQTTVTTPDTLNTYNIDGVYDFIDTYLSDCTIIIPDIVVKHSHNVTLNTSDISYGESANVNITVSSVDSGNISYTVKSGNNVIKEEVNKEFSNNSMSIVLDNLDVGTYTVTVTVLATEEYGETTVSRTFTVNRVTPNISVIVNNVTTLDNVTVNVTVPEGVTGQILIQIGEVYAGGGAANRIVDDKTVQVKSGDSVIITYAPFAAKDTYALGWSFTSNNTNYNSVSNNNWYTGEGLSKLIKFEVVKADSNLTVKADDVDWGNNVTVSITTDSRFTGNITVKLGDDEKIAEIKDGSGNVSFANLKADTYNVTAKFNETDLFAPSQKDINVTVNKVNSTLTLDDIVFDWNKTGSTTVSYSGATNVEAVIVETGTSIPIQGNTITVSNLKAGNYTLRVTTVADENHTGVTKDVNIKVNKVNSTLTLGDDIIFNYGESGSTTVSYEGATSVVAEVVDNTATIKIENGNITVSGLDASNYTLKVTTQVDENHTSISKTVNIKVNKVDSDINILNPVNYVYGNVGQCSVFSDGVINFTAVIVDHPEANITIDNGIVNVSGLKVGNYTLRVTANPDRNHNSVFRECNVTVNMAEVPADQALNITVPADSQSPTFSINLDSSAEGNFTVYVDGKEWGTVKVVNGSASITVANLPAGNHNITISYSGDDNHAAIVQNTTLSISKIATGISASKVTAVYLTSKKLVVTLKDKAGNILTGMKVTVKVGSISKTLTTDSKGQVSVDVSKLVPKTYTAKFTFAGDDKYLKSEGSASVKINKAASKITAKKKTFKAKKKTKKYTITLKSGKKAIGKVKVTIKIGKKTFKAKTNKKGKATFKVKKLTKKAKYNAVIKFKGNKYYKATTKKVKIVLK